MKILEHTSSITHMQAPKFIYVYLDGLSTKLFYINYNSFNYLTYIIHKLVNPLEIQIWQMNTEFIVEANIFQVEYDLYCGQKGW